MLRPRTNDPKNRIVDSMRLGYTFARIDIHNYTPDELSTITLRAASLKDQFGEDTTHTDKYEFVQSIPRPHVNRIISRLDDQDLRTEIRMKSEHNLTSQEFRAFLDGYQRGLATFYEREYGRGSR